MFIGKYFICCEQCFETIGKKSTKAARFWMDLCALSLHNGEPVILTSKDFPELRALELMGFIISSEQSKSIAVRIQGRCHNSEGQDCYCIKSGRHE